jgi:hypothetical protein
LIYYSLFNNCSKANIYATWIFILITYSLHPMTKQKIKEYKIISEVNPWDLNDPVNNKIQEWRQPLWQPFGSNVLRHQLLVIYDADVWGGLPPNNKIVQE